MGFWKSLFAPDPGPTPPTAAPGCPHNLIRAHTTSYSRTKGIDGRIVICTCLDCGDSLDFHLGTVVQDMIPTVTADVLKANGYQQDPEKTGNVWLRGTRE